MKKIILTGGGTAGHVTPNIALIPTLREMGYDIHYIGSHNGIEKKLITEIGIPYYGISSGKLRRYFDPKNFSDPFRVIKGMGDAERLILKLKPDVVFSKGGFVSVPVVLEASFHKVPVVIHESDMTPGLANRIALPRASRVCCNFPETAERFPEGIATVTGTPIRKELYEGKADRAFSYCGFTEKKPTILVVGGSTGSVSVNNAIHHALPELLKTFNVIHICGEGKADPAKNGTPGYAQFEYVKEQLADMFALADIVISRAGANAICELRALQKPNILVPLGLDASRGDQILNAESFEKSGFSKVVKDDELSDETILSAIKNVQDNKDKYIKAMKDSSGEDAISMICSIIDSVAKK